jgi:hypothetical protein
MRLLVTVDGIDTAIIGYVAKKDNKVFAIVAPWPTPDGGYGVCEVALAEIRFAQIPDGLRRRLSRQMKRREREAMKQEDNS